MIHTLSTKATCSVTFNITDLEVPNLDYMQHGEELHVIPKIVPQYHSAQEPSLRNPRGAIQNIKPSLRNPRGTIQEKQGY